jgi:hypothetical protein
VDRAAALLSLAAIWAVAMPMLVVAARRINGVDTVPAAIRLGLATQE